MAGIDVRMGLGRGAVGGIPPHLSKKHKILQKYRGKEKI